MELSVAITLMVGLTALAIIGAKVGRNYFDVETAKHQKSVEHQLETQELTQQLVTLSNSNRNYIYKIRRMRDEYELDYEDVDYREEDDEELRLSDLAKSIYPQLPASVSKLIDKEEFQNAIVKTVEKRPEFLTKFVDMYLNKTGDSTTSTPASPKLKSQYL